jgi:outer membrane protease
MSRTVRLVLIGLSIGLSIGLAMTVNTGAAAGELDRAYLRGSTVDQPSYPILPADYTAGAEPARYPVKSAPAAAPDFAPAPAPIAHTIEFEVGGRYWASSGKLAKNLYDNFGVSQSVLSRLTYSGLTANSGEVYARAETISGIFVKGYAGLGGIGKGSLNDEDFPPGIDPYSSTLSKQQNGQLSYLSADIGYEIVTGPRYRVGAFAGYHYFAERVNAFGCTQVATNPFVCVPAIPSSVLGITEDAKWNAARLGLAADVKLTDCLKLTIDAAWVPYATITASDTHWLRLGTSFSGPIPESGSGSGAQIEAALSYQFTNAFSFGVGARYWHMETRGSADFGAVVAGAQPQPVNFVTDRFGAYLQGAYRFSAL